MSGVSLLAPDESCVFESGSKAPRVLLTLENTALGFNWRS